MTAWRRPVRGQSGAGGVAGHHAASRREGGDDSADVEGHRYFNMESGPGMQWASPDERLPGRAAHRPGNCEAAGPVAV